MTYPTEDTIKPIRQREFLIASDFVHKEYGSSYEIRLGNDDLGVPDAFVFDGDNLLACIELVGYILGQINELQSHKMMGHMTFNIDIEESTRIHNKQPHPYTLIGKKIQGERQYEKFDAKELILLIHTEVYVKNDNLCFAMDGMMQMNPSVNNFVHHKDEITKDLINISQKNRSEQWDRIALIDYTYSPVIEQCPVVNICC